MLLGLKYSGHIPHFRSLEVWSRDDDERHTFSLEISPVLINV